jgi:hypothetical protein
VSDKPGIMLEIYCSKLPGLEFNEHKQVRLGLQVGRDVEQDVRGNSETAKFSMAIEVVAGKGEHLLDFRGPAVHGTAGDRFIYLSWGERDGETWAMFARAKLKITGPLNLLAPQALTSQLPIVAELEMTGASGGPVCASIKSDAVRWSV